MAAGAKHGTPFMMEVEPAARLILHGIAARRSEMAFPWPAANIMAVVRGLPNFMYDRLWPMLLERRRTSRQSDRTPAPLPGEQPPPRADQ
jgi:hypothetical protein